MTKARFDGLLMVLLGSVVFLLLGALAESGSPSSMLDFKVIYYAARTCFITTILTTRAKFCTSSSPMGEYFHPRPFPTACITI